MIILLEVELLQNSVCHHKKTQPKTMASAILFHSYKVEQYWSDQNGENNCKIFTTVFHNL